MRKLAIATVVVAVCFGGCGSESQTEVVERAKPGSDSDERGCIGSAGYLWCERTKQCERPWELAEKKGFEKSQEHFDSYCVSMDDAALTQSLKAIRGKSEAVGFALGIIENGNVTYARGFGVKSQDHAGPVDANSNFHWASVSKPVVATAIMQLAERGVLDLDAKLVEVLADYKITDPRHRDISIRQILLHISGLPDVEDYGWDKPEYDETALRRWVLEDSPRDLLFDPGSAREYSNVGFEVLGLVIERISGLSFTDYVRENIFEPLQMEQSTFYYPDTLPVRRTTGHAGAAGSKYITPYYPYNRRHEPSSTLNTSINEIARYALALLNGGVLDGARILSQEALCDMWAPMWKINEDPLQAATMGWVYQEREGIVLLRHFGSDDGFRSALILMPETKSAILFASNDEEVPQREIILAALAALTSAGTNRSACDFKSQPRWIESSLR